ncbi:hypothetical protein, partial [Brevundimonas aurantiaca]|uniref:hypothetical protein n=1 Tax=Brevundimonas aurantiaca TaxID=74316 RepID=UPI0029675626
TSAGLLRWLMAAQTGLLPTQPITAQINLGLSLWLDEKRGSRQRGIRFSLMVMPCYTIMSLQHV